jgi:hypothetical protein
VRALKLERSRGGLTADEGKILKEWGDEYGLPVRGPEAHQGRPFGSKPHFHVGPIRHIPWR